MSDVTPLSTRIREATAAEHRAAESRGFITALMEGDYDLATYAVYLTQLAHVYRALESRESSAADPALIRDDRLTRLPSITADLRALGLAAWTAEAPMASTLAYVARLEEAAAGDAPRYLAHHYTRYLGDLSGGQAIGARMKSLYGASDEQLSFYRFEQIPAGPRYKNEYRAAMDAVGFTPEQEDAFVDEALVAFRLNGAVFDELGSRVGVPA